MKIKFKGLEKEFENETTIKEIAKSFSAEFEKTAVCGKINNKLIDLNVKINSDCEIEIITKKSPEYQDVLKHSASHILSQAVKTVFPTVKCWVATINENGFYYDFDFKTPITNDDLSVIEDEMNKIIKANFEITRKEISKKEALEIMKEVNEPYKVELIESFPDDKNIILYSQGDYVDVCTGPHVKSTSKIKAFKLTKLSGAYLQDDKNRKMLTRIYGVVFDKKSEMEEYFKNLEA